MRYPPATRVVWLSIASAALAIGLFAANTAFDPVVIHADTPLAAPSWAVMERYLIGMLNKAGADFVAKYANPDGSMRWMDRYWGGMNSSDDSYEAFRGFSLLYIAGGSKELDRLHRFVWDGLTREWTRYGNVYREFDSNWDWMHHGEGYTDFYTFGLGDPQDTRFRDRSFKFAAMYIGEDPESPNYDPDKNIIRASMTGSRGPKMSWTVRDWRPTNANLTYYHLPFSDIPGVASPTGWINDDTFAVIVKTMSDRMARGDVPINLTATPMVANAYLYSGDAKYKDWILKYIRGWEERTERNHGITPDNVGLSGAIGEYMNGNWWGGYYGWAWPRGGADVIAAEITSARVAMLLTGQERWFDLPRSQLELVRKNGKTANGKFLIPERYNEHGWTFFKPESISPYVQMWSVTMDPRDLQNIERIASELQLRAKSAPDERGLNKIRPGRDLEWVDFLEGRNPGFPEKSLKEDAGWVQRQIDAIRNEHGDPDTWVDNKWSTMNPMAPEALLRLTMGAVPVDIRGEMLYAALRYFDADRKVPGLPADVGALVTKMNSDSVDVELVNTNAFAPRRVVVQAGAYGEHQITEISGAALAEKVAVNRSYFQVNLAPGAGVSLHISMKRFANTPKYNFPWN